MVMNEFVKGNIVWNNDYFTGKTRCVLGTVAYVRCREYRMHTQLRNRSGSTSLG